jgi:hypothetical protein
VEVVADPTAVLELIGRAFGVDRAAIRLAMARPFDDSAKGMFTASSDALDSVCVTSMEANLGGIRGGGGRSIITSCFVCCVSGSETRPCRSGRDG